MHTGSRTCWKLELNRSLLPTRCWHNRTGKYEAEFWKRATAVSFATHCSLLPHCMPRYIFCLDVSSLFLCHPVLSGQGGLNFPRLSHSGTGAHTNGFLFLHFLSLLSWSLFFTVSWNPHQSLIMAAWSCPHCNAEIGNAGTDTVKDRKTKANHTKKCREGLKKLLDSRFPLWNVFRRVWLHQKALFQAERPH
jgi:hypothetical protein